MKLRQKSKRDQTLDAVASVAKTWSEWRLGKRATTTVTKGAKKASKLKESGGTSTRLKIAGAVALVGGIGAAVAKKVIGGQAEPLSDPPGRAPDMEPPPPPVAVEDLDDGAPAQPETGTGEHRSSAVDDLPPPKTPIVVEDLSGEAPAESAPGYSDAPADPDAAAAADDADADAAAPADEPANKAS